MEIRAVVKIISTVNYSEWNAEVECKNCFSLLQIEVNDLKRFSGFATSAQEDIDNKYYCFCPVCSKQINFPLGFVPEKYRFGIKSENYTQK